VTDDEEVKLKLADLERVVTALEDVAVLRANLRATQERCNELLSENRKLRSHNASMKLRWLQLLEQHGWEQGPDDDSCVFDYHVDYDQNPRAYIIERDVSPPPHRCVEDGHGYGHDSTCYYCGHEDKA
jgi:hypothetical protein